MSFCVICEGMRQDTNTVHAFTDKVITYIKEKLPAITQFTSVKKQLVKTKILLIYAITKLTMGLKLNGIFCDKSWKVTL